MSRICVHVDEQAHSVQETQHERDCLTISTANPDAEHNFNKKTKYVKMHPKNPLNSKTAIVEPRYSEETLNTKMISLFFWLIST